GDLVAGEPVLDVGETAHRADLDLLLLAELFRRYAAVDPVGEPTIALALRLDDGRGVHAGGGAEGIRAGNRIVHGKLVSRRLRRELDEPHQAGHVPRPVDRRAHQLDVYQQLIAVCVADALADARRAAIHARPARRARLLRCALLRHGVGTV